MNMSKDIGNRIMLVSNNKPRLTDPILLEIINNDRQQIYLDLYRSLDQELLQNSIFNDVTTL